MEIVVDVELIKTKYLEFKQKETTELHNAEQVARESAAKLRWNEISTQQMVDYVVGKAKEQLLAEKTFWDAVVSEREEEVVEDSSFENSDLEQNDIFQDSQM